MSDEYQDKSLQVSPEQAFRDRMPKYALKAGIKVIYVVLLLYYALREPKTPAWAKGVILGALGYAISPLDAIPDFIPVAGYSDDFGVVMLALATVALFINKDVKAKARQKIAQWFPDIH